MNNNEQKPNSPSCGPDCTCNSKKGLSVRTKAILLAIIVIAAGVVLGNSLLRKSRSAGSASQPSGYSGVLSSVPAAIPSPDTLHDSASAAKPAAQAISIAPLASFESLNTVARDVDGVFILLVNAESQKTPAMLEEIASAIKAIALRGVNMSAFQLSATSQDFAEITSHMALPGVLAVIKGKGMRGVQGADITRTKLLQACLAAMQPTSCCPAGGKRVCK